MKPITRNLKVTNTKSNNTNHQPTVSTRIIDRNSANYNTYPNTKTDISNYTTYLSNEPHKTDALINEQSSYKENINNILQPGKFEIIPSGEIKIEKNGTYDIYNYAQANIHVRISGDYYDGDYLIIPSAQKDIILDTTNKYVEDDITVKKIAFLETHNTYGTTIYIG